MTKRTISLLFALSATIGLLAAEGTTHHAIAEDAPAPIEESVTMCPVEKGSVANFARPTMCLGFILDVVSQIKADSTADLRQIGINRTKLLNFDNAANPYFETIRKEYPNNHDLLTKIEEIEIFVEAARIQNERAFSKQLEKARAVIRDNKDCNGQSTTCG